MCSREGAKAQRCRSRPVVVVSAPAAALTNSVRERSTTPHAHYLGAFAPSREHIDGSPDTTVAKGPGVDFVRAEARRRGESEAGLGSASCHRRTLATPIIESRIRGRPQPPERSISALTLRVSASPREPNQRQPKPPPSGPATPAKHKRKGRPACADLPDLHSVTDPRADWRKSYWPEPGP